MTKVVNPGIHMCEMSEIVPHATFSTGHFPLKNVYGPLISNKSGRSFVN